jgi:proteasome lid subunit RPN8/RPN11
MRYTLTIRDEEFDSLIAEIFSVGDTEGAAYLLCGVSKTETEYRLLVRSVHPVKQAHYRRRERAGLSIISESYVQIAKSAARDIAAIVFVHSHPDGPEDFSPQDDIEDPKLHRFFHARVPTLLHGSLVIARFDGIQSVRGRVWTDDGWAVIDRMRIQGARFRFVDRGTGKADAPIYFDRQVRALGKAAQQVLKGLHIGVVGVGGTGSAVVEQLARLGVGTISVFDKDLFDETNVNRVYGSTTCDTLAPRLV